jgi:hypothetical protein
MSGGWGGRSKARNRAKCRFGQLSRAVRRRKIAANDKLGELRVAAAASDADALKEELKDFKRKISEAGRATYSARVGAHDDLVLSVAIALWMATQGQTTSVHELRL